MIETIYTNTREVILKKEESKNKQLKSALLAFGLLIALGEGFKIYGNNSDQSEIAVYVFSFPVSFLFLVLYMKELCAIEHIKVYLTKFVRENRESDKIFLWDDITKYRDQEQNDFRYEMVVAMMTFIGIPTLQLLRFYWVRKIFDGPGITLFILSLCCATYMLYVFVKDFKKIRRLQQGV